MGIETRIENRIAEIIFNVPPVNAFDSETWMAIPGIITDAARNPDVNCILIRAEGRGFCGGVDIKEMQAHPERITVLNRGNYLTFKAIRDAWPDDKPAGVRFNGTDWDDDGLTVHDAVAFAQELKKLGCDFFDVSGGGNSMVRPAVGPGYQAHLARAVKHATGVPTIAVGMIRDPKLAEQLIRDGSCDMVAIARGFLYEPRWTWRAAHELGAEGVYPPQYARANPKLWPQAFEDAEGDESEWEEGASPHILVLKGKQQ